MRSAEYEVLHNGDLIEMEVRFQGRIYTSRILLEKFHVKGNIVREHNIWTQLDDVVDYMYLATT